MGLIKQLVTGGNHPVASSSPKYPKHWETAITNDQGFFDNLADLATIYTHRIHGAGIYANIWGILMVNVTIYSIHGSYGIWNL